MTGQYPTEFDEILWLRSELRNALAKVDRLRAELLTSYGQNQDLLDESKPVVWTDRKPDRPGEWWYRTTKKINGAVVTVYESGQPKRLMAFAMPVESWDFQWSSEPCQPPEEPTT